MQHVPAQREAIRGEMRGEKYPPDAPAVNTDGAAAYAQEGKVA